MNTQHTTGTTTTPPPQQGQGQDQKQQQDQKDAVYKANPEYPFLVYNHKTLDTKAAKDKDEYDKLHQQGYTDDPLPPVDTDYLTRQDVQQLEALLHKAAVALAKLGQLSQAQHAQETGQQGSGQQQQQQGQIGQQQQTGKK